MPDRRGGIRAAARQRTMRVRRRPHGHHSRVLHGVPVPVRSHYQESADNRALHPLGV